jgi:hypothetical protein
MHQYLGAHGMFGCRLDRMAKRDTIPGCGNDLSIDQMCLRSHEFADALEFPVSCKAVSVDRRAGFRGRDDFDWRLCCPPD